MDRMQLAIARCGLAAVLFGATTPLAAELADDVSAPVLAGLLYLGAAAAVAPLAGRRRLDRGAVRRGTGRLVAAVAAGGFAGPLLLAAGLARTPGATASLLLNLELVATTVLAAVLFREHVGTRVVGGTALVVGAGIVLVWSGTPDLRVGALLLVGACLCWGLDNCVTAALDDVAPEHLTLLKGAVAGSTNLALGLLLGAEAPGLATVAGSLALGAVGYGASITLWVAGARDLGAARGQLVFSSAPFIGVLVAWTALDEPVRAAEVAAVALAGAGVLRVLRSDHEHAHEHEPVQHEHEHAHDDGHHDHRHEPGTAAVGASGHTHRHVHERTVHAHPHVPDLHHRHDHG